MLCPDPVQAPWPRCPQGGLQLHRNKQLEQGATDLIVVAIFVAGVSNQLLYQVPLGTLGMHLGAGPMGVHGVADHAGAAVRPRFVIGERTDEVVAGPL